MVLQYQVITLWSITFSSSTLTLLQQICADHSLKTLQVSPKAAVVYMVTCDITLYKKIVLSWIAGKEFLDKLTVYASAMQTL